MANKQTAVEWLDRWFRDNPEATHEEGNRALQQAKEIEKEQIIDSFNFGTINWDKDITAEQFYNQTYGRTSN